MSLNDEQRGYMCYLATVPAEKKCWCAWYMAGECPNCKDLGTLVQRLKVQCPGCDNYPPVTNQTRPVVHRIGCTSPDWQPDTSAVTRPKLCSHEAIIGLDGKWHCQRCGDAIEMATASQHPSQEPR